MTKLAVALLFLGLNGYVYWYMGSGEVIPPRAPFSKFPDTIGDWQCEEREALDPAVIDNLKLADYVSCSYASPSEPLPVHLYVSYHERQTRDRNTGEVGAIHPPEHCLPGSGWDVIDAKVIPIDLAIPGEAKRFVIAKGSHRAVVYFWYQSNGRVFARNYQKILWMFLDRTTRQRSDGSLVRFTIPIPLDGGEEAADTSFQDFAARVAPLLPDYVPN
ncbi:MAG: EpsI family protein [Myxococcota bacterium]